LLEDYVIIEAGNVRMMRAISLFLTGLLMSPFVYGKTIYVDDDAAGANNGTSWDAERNSPIHTL
jgi:hypothetical protein